jgi:catechol 2,3-dioxygenase-like lactoylglutathione lyase family enzyme
MSVELNHTIVYAGDKRASAAFLAGILGIPVSPDVARFVPLQLANGVTLDYFDADNPAPQHYAFTVSSDIFDAALTRVTEAGIGYFSEPSGEGQSRLYHKVGCRGFYFCDLDGHLMELMTHEPDAA